MIPTANNPHGLEIRNVNYKHFLNNVLVHERKEHDLLYRYVTFPPWIYMPTDQTMVDRHGDLQSGWGCGTEWMYGEIPSGQPDHGESYWEVIRKYQSRDVANYKSELFMIDIPDYDSKGNEIELTFSFYEWRHYAKLITEPKLFKNESDTTPTGAISGGQL